MLSTPLWCQPWFFTSLFIVLFFDSCYYYVMSSSSPYSLPSTQLLLFFLTSLEQEKVLYTYFGLILTFEDKRERKGTTTRITRLQQQLKYSNKFTDEEIDFFCFILGADKGKMSKSLRKNSIDESLCDANNFDDGNRGFVLKT